MAYGKIVLNNNGRKMIDFPLTFSYNSRVQINSTNANPYIGNAGDSIYLSNGGYIAQHNISPSYDITTFDTTADASIDTSAYSDSKIQGILFNPSGNKVLVASYSSASTWAYSFMQYTLSTNWLLSSAGTPVRFYTGRRNTNHCWNDDGTKLYNIDHAFTHYGKLRQYTLTTAYDLSTASFEKENTSVVSKFGNSVYNYP